MGLFHCSNVSLVRSGHLKNSRYLSFVTWPTLERFAERYSGKTRVFSFIYRYSRTRIGRLLRLMPSLFGEFFLFFFSWYIWRKADSVIGFKKRQQE